MKLITVLWHERGYSSPQYATATALPRATRTVTRNLVQAARANASTDGVCRVHGLRVKISAL